VIARRPGIAAAVDDDDPVAALATGLGGVLAELPLHCRVVARRQAHGGEPFFRGRVGVLAVRAYDTRDVDVVGYAFIKELVRT